MHIAMRYYIQYISIWSPTETEETNINLQESNWVENVTISVQARVL